MDFGKIENKLRWNKITMHTKKNVIEKAIKLYNKYRSPEAHAELVSLEKDKVIVKFEGTFCKTCGVNDWIEDFKYVLEDLNIKTELEEIYEPMNSSENFRIGIFKVKSGKNSR